MKTLALSLAALLLTAAPAAFAAPPAGHGIVRTPAPSRTVVVVKQAPMTRAEKKAAQLENRIDRLERELALTRRRGGSFRKQRNLQVEIAELKRDLRDVRAQQYARYDRRGPDARRDDWRRR